jgi:hypothetical protein
MAFEGQQGSDLRVTLALSQEEAQSGSSRTLTLPEGRQITVSIPPGTRDGQEIRVEGQGQLSPYSGTRGALILTMSIIPGRNPYASTQYGRSDNDAPTDFITTPPPQTAYSAGSYGGANTYPPREQGQLFLGGQAPPNYTQPGQYQYVPPPPPVQSQPQNQYQYVPPPPLVQPQPQKQPRRGLSTGMTILLVILAVLLIGGSGFAYYVGVYQPNKVHSDATATADTHATATGQVNATFTAQAQATGQVQANQTATARAQASATVAAFQSIYTQATSGNPILNDPLTRQDANSWDQGNNCFFTNNAYHVKETDKGFFFYCIAESSNFSNFAYQIQMNFIQGNSGGIIFRADGANARFYFFRIGLNGTYDLYVYVDRVGSHAKTLTHGTSSLISNHSDTLTVVARGSNLYLYVNKQYLTSLSDGSLTSGQIGVAADYTDQPTEIAFNQAQVWGQ